MIYRMVFSIQLNKYLLNPCCMQTILPEANGYTDLNVALLNLREWGGGELKKA